MFVEIFLITDWFTFHQSYYSIIKSHVTTSLWNKKWVLIVCFEPINWFNLIRFLSIHSNQNGSIRWWNCNFLRSQSKSNHCKFTIVSIWNFNLRPTSWRIYFIISWRLCFNQNASLIWFIESKQSGNRSNQFIKQESYRFLQSGRY